MQVFLKSKVMELTESLLIQIAQTCEGYKSLDRIDFTETNQLVTANPLLSQELPLMNGTYYRIDFEHPEQATRFRKMIGQQGFINAHVTTNGVAFAVVAISQDFENPYQ